MKRHFTAFATACVLAVTLAVTGCAAPGEANQWGMGNKQTLGSIAGAGLGAVVGSNIGGGKGRTAAIAAGTLLGAFVGSSVGQSLDRADLNYHENAVQQAYSAPLNQSISWNNPESGHSGIVTPIREGHNKATGNVCREYRQTINIGEKSETAIGQACQNSDGTWSIVN